MCALSLYFIINLMYHVCGILCLIKRLKQPSNCRVDFFFFSLNFLIRLTFNSFSQIRVTFNLKFNTVLMITIMMMMGNCPAIKPLNINWAMSSLKIL